VIGHSVTSIRQMIPQGYYRHEVGRFAGAPSSMQGDPAVSAGLQNSSGSPASAALHSGAAPAGSAVVEKAQRILRDVGIYHGTVDGMMGPETAAAVRDFQSQLGLEATGEVDLKTMRELNALVE
jgi:peptidoglycan hydrolase-like protein with peptidoglycan-binding domain